MSSNEKIKKCEDTFCKEYTKKIIKTTKDMVTFVILTYKKKFDTLDNKAKNEFKLKIKNLKDKLKSNEFKNETKD